jgi:hypothetical protein
MADEMTPEQPNLVQQYVKSVQDRKLEAEAQMQKLMRALDSRRNMPFDPVGLRVAGALLAPTKTGGAGESFGYAATAAADEMQKQALQNAEFAKMEFELSQKQQAQKIAQDEQNFAMQYFNRKRPPVAPAVPAAPAPAAPVEAPAEPADVIGSTAMRGEPPAASVDAIPGEPLINRMQRLAQSEAPMQAPIAEPPAAPAAAQAPVRQLEDEDDAFLAIFAPNVLKIKRDLAEEKRKQEQLGLDVRKTEAQERVTIESGGTKFSLPKVDADRIANAIDKKDYKTAERLYEKYGMPFPFVKEGENYRLKTSAESAREIEVAKGIEAKVYPTRFGPISMLPADYFRFRTIDEADPKAGEEFLRRIVAREATSPAGEKPKLITEDERKYRESKQTEVMKEDVKASAEQAALVQKRATDAFELKEAIDDLDSRAKSNPKIFGLMQGPGYAKAIARAVDDGTNMVKLGKIAEGKLSREDLLALQDAANAEAKVRNLMRKAARIPGEGATSDLETRMQVALALTTSMSPEIVRIRAEVMRERINFDEKVFELWSKYKKSEKGYFQEFLTESKEYKDLKKNYENKLKTIRDANSEFFSRSARASSAASRSEAPRSNAPSGGNVQRFLD